MLNRVGVYVFMNALLFGKWNTFLLKIQWWILYFRVREIVNKEVNKVFVTGDDSYQESTTE